MDYIPEAVFSEDFGLRTLVSVSIIEESVSVSKEGRLLEISIEFINFDLKLLAPLFLFQIFSRKRINTCIRRKFESAIFVFSQQISSSNSSSYLVFYSKFQTHKPAVYLAKPET